MQLVTQRISTAAQHYRGLVGCDIWYGWWDGACCLLADPSSPSRRSSIRPEPLEADLSERRSQVVTLSSSSLATAASAGLLHCNAQLLSYRDWQNYTWPISRRSQGPKTGGIIQKVDQWKDVPTHHPPAVCEISVWKNCKHPVALLSCQQPSHTNMLQCINPTSDTWREMIT